MDKLVLELVENGKDINEVLDMPYKYIVEVLKDKNKPEYKKSLIAAFNG
ncbi:phage tail assembly chaperone GT [Jeotgalibaca porci]